MKRIRKWLINIGIVLLILAIVLGGIGVWFVHRPWPQISGTVSVPGLLAPVEVIRDQWGIPHIYAQNDHDLVFTQGYVHAQDRLWQMEANRRICKGMLSEIVGKPVVDLDRYMRTIGLRRVAEQSWADLDDDSQVLLETYAEGVNAYIESHRHRLPLEFTILGVDPEPWTPIDSMVWGNMMALRMSLNSWSEVFWAKVVAELGEEKMQQLFLSSAEDMPVIIPAETGGYSWLRNTQLKELFVMGKWLGNPFQSWGSNNWVVHGNRTTTGMPFLANDVHMDLPMPSAWYENGLHGGRFDSIGFTLPGVPLVVIGHNQHNAWGITNLDPDVQDMYIEKLDDLENPTQYEFMGAWYDLDVIRETIEVKGSDSVNLDILLTRHGPIINKDAFQKQDEEPMALRWTLYEGSVVFRSILRLNLATNWNEFCDALQDWDALSQNFVYADVEGNIAYHTAGKVPIRVPEHQGTLPVPGWTGEYEWQGFISFDELPVIFNPPTDFIATANNRVVSGDYPYQLCIEWFPGYRAIRINDLLAAGNRFNIEDMQHIQAQTYSLSAEILRPYLLAVEPENDLQAKALAYVKAWDLYLERDRVGASIYETWYQFMVQNTFSDELSDELIAGYQYRLGRHGESEMVKLMADAENSWFDDVNTPEVETRDDIARRSLADTLDWLSERYGEDPGKWQWARLHTMTFTHIPLGESGISPIERIFNGGPVPVPGGQSTVNQAMYRWPDQPFSVYHGTAQRVIMDLSNFNTMLAVNSTGQSGHLFHPHREDQIPIWQNVEYHLLPFSREGVETNAESTLTLVPRNDLAANNAK
jgi:penicillin amidase